MANKNSVSSVEISSGGKTANKEFAALMTAIDPTWRAAEVEVLA